MSKIFYKPFEEVKDFNLTLTWVNTCSCCGKEFKSEDPKQDICISCLSEIADLEQIDK